ncbi:hypothetical protein D3C72_1150250 [compost metagenome]
MPAKNAPSAIDRPSRSVSAAMPSVTSSRFSMNSSCERRAATTWNQRLISRCPTKKIRPRATTILTVAKPRAAASSPGSRESAGMMISSGTTARSWNSSTLMMLRPCSASSSMRSESILETMAVEDMASAPPSATEACHDSGKSQLKAQLAGTTASIDSTTCEPPSPNTRRFIDCSLLRLNSSPIENIRKTTPNSARYLVCAVSLASPSAWGPIRMPTAR